MLLVGSHASDVTATVTDALSGPAAALVGADVTASDVATAGAGSKSLTGTDMAGNEATASCPFTVLVPPASELTLTTRRIVVIGRRTRGVRVTCTLDRPTLGTCALALRAGKRTLAIGQATADAGAASATVTLALSRRARRLARRPGGLAATLDATASQTRGEQLRASIPLQLLPSAVVSAPTDGLFKTGSAKLPRNGTAYLRRLRELVTGARQLTCTGHTDNRGSRNQTNGSDSPAPRPSAHSSPPNDIRTRARSEGETKPRAPNTTAQGRARNRYVSVQVRY